MEKIFIDKPKLEQPESFITPKDRALARRIFILALFCIIPLSNPLNPAASPLNFALIQAIPSAMSLYLLLLAPAVYFGIITMERCYFGELLKIEARQIEQQKKKQKIHYTARYRDFDNGSCWEITNRSSFAWNHAVLIIEQSQMEGIHTERHELGKVPALRRISIQSNLKRHSNAQWRLMVISEEGHTIDFPERYEKLHITLGE